jgi:predicted acylesterase/phospholipase RssA
VKALRILAGAKALAQIRQHGLRAQDIACIPAAAGGPKGLILNPLDKLLFGHWLKGADGTLRRERHLIGASIGAWRMACGAANDPEQAFDELARFYIEEQRYGAKPTPQEITRVGKTLLRGVLRHRSKAILHNPHHHLHVLTNRGAGMLGPNRLHHKTGFASALLANTASRALLARFMERVVFHAPHGHAEFFDYRFDAFTNRTVPLSALNFEDALLASGSIPLLLEAVRNIHGASEGWYWDGGIIDYHLHLPYNKLDGLTLYPHFSSSITPGWLDKFLPWRRAHKDRHRNWLESMVLVFPSAAFIATLPNKKVPDRADFKHYAADWAARERVWWQAIGQAQLLAQDWYDIDARGDWAARVEPLVPTAMRADA